MRFRANRRRIHVNDSGIQIAHGCERLVDVARVNRRRQSVRHAIGDFNGLLEIVHGNHRDHRPKNFFLGDAHARRAIAEHGRLVEPALSVRAFVQPIATGQTAWRRRSWPIST